MMPGELFSSDIPGIIRPRYSQVFVDIPPSPLFKRDASTSSKVTNLPMVHQNIKLKENAPPPLTKSLLYNKTESNKESVKRKAWIDEDDGVASNVKKTKLANEDGTLIVCHQCRTKKSLSVVLQCTRVSKNSSKRCKASYCETCLKNRYGESLKLIKQTKASSQIDSHVDIGYCFDCPRCKGYCNCAPCRKKQGLTPVGKFVLAKGQGSVRDILEKNPQAHGLTLKMTAKITGEVSKKIINASKDETMDITKNTLLKKEAPNKKQVAEPTWSCVQHATNKADIENRIFLREFVLRFNPILNIGVRNVEELDDFITLHDGSTKAILLSLLDLIAIEDDIQKKTIQGKLKSIRSLGLNWTKIVQVLYDLKATVPKGHALCSIPELDQSHVESFYSTRGTQLRVVHVNQLLPILLYLITIIIDGPSVRQELEEGDKQGRELRRFYLQALREENEAWVAEKASLMETKPEGNQKATKDKDNTWRNKFRAAEAVHRETIANLQNQHRADMDLCASRFKPAGFDTYGRTYYILSVSGPQHGKKERLPNECERMGMKKWGWFIAAFGKPGSVVEGMDENHNNGDEERWWGFADVNEMRNLSKWLAHSAESAPPDGADSSTSSSTTRKPSLGKNRTMSPLMGCSMSDDEDDNALAVNASEAMYMDILHPPSLAGLKALAKAVLEFADFVDWRTKRGDPIALKHRI